MTNLGCAKSPTSGRVSNSSARNHSKNALYRRGERISFSALRMLMTPCPPSVCSQSARLRAGSPKNACAPSFSRVSSWRWIAPTLAADTLPYWVRYSLAWSATYCSMPRRSFKSIRCQPWSSAALNTRLSSPSCVSLRFIRRASSIGPISDTVTRTGMPLSPYTSQKRTGKPCK